MSGSLTIIAVNKLFYDTRSDFSFPDLSHSMDSKDNRPWGRMPAEMKALFLGSA